MNFFKDLRLVDLLRFLVFYLVWYYFKQDLNSNIHNLVHIWFVAFVICCLVGFIISKITTRVFDYFFKVFYLPILDIPLYILYCELTDLICWHILKMDPINTTVQTITPYMYGYQIKALQARTKAIYAHRERIEILEVLAGAMEKDGSDPRHSPLASVFREHCSRLKKLETDFLLPDRTRTNILRNEYNNKFTGERPDWNTFRVIEEDVRLDLKKKISDFLETI
jgi:hypothetical protein